MAGSITSVNCIGMLMINGLYTVPQKLVGYTADDIFDADMLEIAEISMGLDGNLAAGFIPVAVKQTLNFQANSPSITLFEAWYAAQNAAKDIYFSNGIWNFPSLGRSYATANGVLTSYSPMSDAKKTMQSRKFGITWESVIGVPV